MTGILNIAYSGLNAFQNALNVTANNIANQATRGYSRQSILLSSIQSQLHGGVYVGKGVKVNSIYRNVDQFANAQVRSMESVKSQYDTFYQQAIQIDKLLSDNGSSLSTSLQSFFKALGQLNSAPDSSASRNVLLTQSQQLVQQFNAMQRRLDEYQQNTGVQLTEMVGQINSLTTNIASVNGQLVSNPNDPALLDLRDELLRQLSVYSDLSITNQSDGTVNVGLASGEMLVSGTESRNLSVSTDIANPLGATVSLGTGAGMMDVTSRLQTGTLGGLLDYQNTILGQASQLIGQMSIGMAQMFNAQHQLGMDMNNNLGINFFTDYNSTALQLGRAFTNSANTGSAVLSVSITDIGQTQLSDYIFTVTDIGTNQVAVTRKSDGQTTFHTLTQNPPFPPAGQISVDGMTVNVDNIANLNNSDSYTLTPTRGAAKDFALQISNVNQFALASPVRAMPALTNTGQGKIALGSVFNTTAVNNQYVINFTDATHYTIEDVTNSITTGPFLFTPNTNNTIDIPDSFNPSYTVNLSGIPNAGDQFTTEFNTGGIGDNGNGLLLGAIQQNKFLNNGSATLVDTYANLLSQVGSQTNQAKLQLESADVLYRQAINFRDSKSGVNLDEEGANLLRFKQAYEAAGKLLQVTSEIMNALLEAVR